MGLIFVLVILPKTGDRPMTPSRELLALVPVMVAVLLAAGCAGQPAFRNVTPDITAAVAPSTVVIQPTLTTCPPESGNPVPYIIINPISNFTIGDMIEITGTTNLGENVPIQYSVGHPPVPMPTPGVSEPYIPSGKVKITGIDCNEMRWSFLLDSNNLTPWFNDFIITVGTINQTTGNEFYNSTSLITHLQGSGRSWGEVG